jgi:hypothetical protein
MMTAKRSWAAIGFILLAAVALCGSQLGWADPGTSSRYGLKGVKGFYVEVSNLPYDVEGWGLTRADVRRDVELQLRKGGALVLTREQAMDTPTAPRLHVRILASKQHNSPYYNYCTVISFDQGAVLSRDASITVDASTWSKAGLGMVKKKELPAVRAVISEMVDEFLNVYLAENPR